MSEVHDRPVTGGQNTEHKSFTSACIKVQSLEKAEETNGIIKVVEDIINHHTELFLVPIC